jgi:hypothetical protein
VTGFLSPAAQAQIAAAEARRREGIHGLRPIANPGYKQRPTGPRMELVLDDGEFVTVAVPIPGVALWALKEEGTYNNNPVPDLRDRFGGYLVSTIDGDEGVSGYLCVRMSPDDFGRRQVDYHELKWDKIDWLDYRASGGFVKPSNVLIMVRALYAEQAGLSGRKPVPDHRAAIRTLEHALEEHNARS